ncbi:putative cysteine dioxygenase [Erysiphe necator]|uniref:Cysteine dioxygenase n=1 Tax=Uncinula necator TaxID=52586 RepID=A0A0B1PDM4_UNCNE|nr:putative cysteine dioxygenase [Erysiphe necator]
MESYRDTILAVNSFGFPGKNCNYGSNIPLKSCGISMVDYNPHSDTARSHASECCSDQHHTNYSQEIDFNELQQSITSVLLMNISSPLSELRLLLGAYSSNFEHWKTFAHAEPSKQYTRNLVFEVPGVFNLLLLVWNPGKASPVHDHADSHCLMKILKGDLKEERYSFPTESGPNAPLIKISESIFGLNQVAYISDELGLHSITNPSDTDFAVSLHLYFPPNAALRGCHVYDLKNGGARHVIQDSYDSVQGNLMTIR